MRAYEHRHIVSLEETNLVGNVYYVNHLRWQGRVRELFLREYVPDIVKELEHGLALITTKCSCEYLAELSAFDEVLIRMRLRALMQTRILVTFEYWRLVSDEEELVGRGEQQIACMRREGERLIPTAVPPLLQDALRLYAET